MGKKKKIESQHAIIDGRMPGLNELLKSAKSGHGNSNAYSRLKTEWTKRIASELTEQRIYPMQCVWVDFLWVEPNTRRDPDNIAAGGRKLIFDAMVKAKIIKDDNWKHIAGWSDTFEVNKGKPHVLIVLSRQNMGCK